MHRNCEGWLRSLKMNLVYSLACSTFATSKETQPATMNGRPKYKLKTTKVEKSVVEAYKKLERSVVESYFAVENAFVGAYQKIEDKFVDTFLEEVTDENENDNENKEQ